jgi:hypothetical protein
MKKGLILLALMFVMVSISAFAEPAQVTSIQYVNDAGDAHSASALILPSQEASDVKLLMFAKYDLGVLVAVETFVAKDGLSISKFLTVSETITGGKDIAAVLKSGYSVTFESGSCNRE